MSTPQVRVLIVDDDVSQRTSLAQLTASLGFAVTTASDGEDALERHSAQSADVILTDLMMPRMDGFDLLRTLESMGDRTPTIVLTGVGGIEQGISVVHDFKAFWFIEKPVQPGFLRVLLARAAAQKHLINETDILNRQLSHQGILWVHCDTSLEIDRADTILQQNGAEDVFSTGVTEVSTHGVDKR